MLYFTLEEEEQGEYRLKEKMSHDNSRPAFYEKIIYLPSKCRAPDGWYWNHSEDMRNSEYVYPTVFLISFIQ